MGYPTQQQKVDYLFKKIGFSASKTGVAEDQTSGFSGDTKKAPPNEAIPSPLVIPASSLWADTSYIPATPPTSSNGYVGVYSTATAYRMTVDTSVSNNRAFVARSTWGNHSSSINGDWIDTQFGADYLIKVYKGDPSVGAPGVAYTNITAAGTGAGPNDTWFFDYSSGVLNFNGADLDGQLVGIHTDNVYIVGYRYLGTKGVQPAAGIGTFHNLHVSGISTFVGNAYANSEFHVGGTLSVTGITTFNNDVFLLDNNVLRLGNSSDLQLYHTGSNSHVSDRGGVGNLHIESNNAVHIKQNDAEHYMAKFYQGGAVELYNNNSLRFKTTGIGATVFGRTETQSLVVSGFTTTARLDVTGVSTFRDKIDFKATSGITTAQWQPTNNRLAFYDNTKATWGNSADFQIYHQSSATEGTYITNSAGNITFKNTAAGQYNYIHADKIHLRSTTNNEAFLTTIYNGQVTLYHNNIEKFETLGIGATVFGDLIVSGDIDVDGRSELDNVNIAETLNVVGVSTFNANVHLLDDDRLRIGGSAGTFDGLELYHDGSHSYINEMGTGELKINGSGIEILSAADTIRIGSVLAYETQIFHSNAQKLASKVWGINVTGTLDTDQLVVSGISTLTGNVITSGDVQFTGDANNAFWDRSVNSLQFSDNAKATFGSHAGAGDFQIYHDGTTSIIKSGEGNLNLQTASGEVILGNTAGEFGVSYKHNDRVLLRYDNADRFQTTGIGATIFGKTETQSLNVSGIATFSGTVSAASSTGVSGQVLQSTGVGVTWATQPQARSTVTFTATEGQTGFSFNYNVGYVDVFVNGIKLTATDYTATNGTVVTLDTGCVAGDIVEIYSYNIVSGTSGGGGGASILDNLNDVSITGTPVAGEQLQHNGTKFTNDYTLSITTNSTSQTTLHSLSALTYRTFEWTIQATQGSNYHTTKILAVHDGSTVSHTEFATLVIGSPLATYTTDINSGNVRLLVTPSSNSSTAFKTKFTMIKV